MKFRFDMLNENLHTSHAFAQKWTSKGAQIEIYLQVTSSEAILACFLVAAATLNLPQFSKTGVLRQEFLSDLLNAKCLCSPPLVFSGSIHTDLSFASELQWRMSWSFYRDASFSALLSKLHGSIHLSWPSL